MKKMFLLIGALFFATISLNAQVKKIEHLPPQDIDIQDTIKKECFVMKEGKMYHVKNGKEYILEKDVVLKNGAIIHHNGLFKQKDGIEMMLKDDECVDYMGNMHQSHKNHPKKE